MSPHYSYFAYVIISEVGSGVPLDPEPPGKCNKNVQVQVQTGGIHRLQEKPVACILLHVHTPCQVSHISSARLHHLISTSRICTSRHLGCSPKGLEIVASWARGYLHFKVLVCTRRRNQKANFAAKGRKEGRKLVCVSDKEVGMRLR